MSLMNDGPLSDVLAGFAARIAAAAGAQQALCIRAGGSKDFYGNTPRGEILDPRDWSGIESYEPSELVITVRAGTPLALVEATLAAQDQVLAFEPPHFGPDATIGGCVAAGLAGPRRASAGLYGGGLRDFVLGAQLLDGRARLLRFGGTVIKNVAGYDMARVLAGSMGTLGLIVDVSLKVLPRPRLEMTLRYALDESAALNALNYWGGRPLPLSASAWEGGQLMLRLSGSSSAVQSAAAQLGGEAVDARQASDFWRELREQRAAWFAASGPLWRLSIPSTAPPLQLAGEQLLEWGGGLRWLRTQLPAEAIRARAAELGGHATLFRGGDRKQGVFTPLPVAILAIHRRLKTQFDPAGIFNPDRLVAGL